MRNGAVMALVWVWSAATASQATPVAPAGATQAVLAYSRALLAGDCDRLTDLSALIRRHPETRKPFCDGAQTWKQAGMLERLRFPTSSRASGRYRMVVVPNSRIVVSEKGPLIANGFYVAVSSDAGRHWQVIDIGCDRLVDWVKGEYPPYDGQPSFAGGSVDVLTPRLDRHLATHQ